MVKKQTKAIRDENSLFGAVHQDRGDFLLPQIVDYLKNRKWIDPRPPYQRRLVWNSVEKSTFLESLLLNLPVPPLFLFERSYGEWEIMDGQQRSNAIVDFYEGELRLKGLKRWASLNGKTYGECSEDVRKNFDRRRLQVTTVLAESSEDPDFDVRKEVFERLNTGGRPLRGQEIRNCLYAGRFCDLLDELSSLKEFTTLWKIPAHKAPRALKAFPPELLANPLFARMEDCELVLRFFALGSSKFFTGSVKSALDKCMGYYAAMGDEGKDVLLQLEERFSKTIKMVIEVYGGDAILIRNSSNKKVPSKQLYDALLATTEERLDQGVKMKAKSKRIQSALGKLLEDDGRYDELITRHDNRKAFGERKRIIGEMIDGLI